MLPSVSEDSSEVGMMFWKNSIAPPDACAFSASSAPAHRVGGDVQPGPGLMRLPTSRPMPSATVDIDRK